VSNFPAIFLIILLFLKRYIYVGVSRAAFFLGITLNADKKDVTKYFKEELNWAKVQ
jgi:hypothetical protein